jgi:hypothetical protein
LRSAGRRHQQLRLKLACEVGEGRAGAVPRIYTARRRAEAGRARKRRERGEAATAAGQVAGPRAVMGEGSHFFARLFPRNP